MAVTYAEPPHIGERSYYIRLLFGAQGDTILLKFPSVRRHLGAQAAILTGGNLTAFIVTILQSMNGNPLVTPVEPCLVLTEADLHGVPTVDAPFLQLLVTTTAWTGASSLEVVLEGVF